MDYIHILMHTKDSSYRRTSKTTGRSVGNISSQLGTNHRQLHGQKPSPQELNRPSSGQPNRH